MLKTVVGYFIAVCTLLPANIAFAADIPSASVALKSATAACSVAAATGRFETTSPVTIYMNIPRSTGQVQSIKDAPDLVQRYIATSAGGVPPQLVYQFKATTGSVWAILRSWVDRCDIMVSGIEDKSVGDDAANFFAMGNGWRLVAKENSHLNRVKFVKIVPQANFQNYGIAALVSNAGASSDNLNGIQIEINLIAGDISLSDTTVNVKTIRPAINPILP